MKELIGLKFKRNKYGLSNWTDTVLGVQIIKDFNNDGDYFTPRIMVKGSIQNYELEDIVFVND